jgi:hypothetical protein
MGREDVNQNAVHFWWGNEEEGKGREGLCDESFVFKYLGYLFLPLTERLDFVRT